MGDIGDMGDAAGTVTVRLLGPVHVRRGGAEVDLGGPKQLAVLSVLALAGGRPCSATELATAVWGHDVPPSAPGTLRAYVSRMRSRLPDGIVDRSAAGWRLAVRREDVDALRFQDLVAAADQAEPAERRALLEEALALWSGPPLGGLDSVPGAAAHREHLVELRAAAAERLLALRLAAGERREVVREASVLAAELPYREGPVTLLATALARSGRHADALAAVSRLRDRLADDLGLDPSPTLEDLHRRLLLHDPTLLGDGGPGDDGQTRRSLPLPLTSFVGRDSDLRAVEDALTISRLVTLVGPGGAGKTRLAVEALRRHDQAGTDGPWVVELGYVAEPGQVIEAVAQTLGVTSTGRVDAAAIAEAVSGRPLLILLDTCEHLVDEVATLVTRLLGACGGMQVLATSREVLGVPGERVLAVEPLPTGRPGAPGDAELLFAERAASVVPGFTLDATTAPAVHRLVRALDGIPLAVELAAARLAVMGLDDLLAMLDDRFAVLEGGVRTAPPHQRTLEATVAWSYDLLDDEERALFRTASAFAGPFTLAALRGLADEHARRSVVGLLASLTAKSMVQVDRAADARESRTYRLLETMRVFGRGRTDTSTAADLADTHLRWFASDAEAAFTALRGPGARECLTHLDLARPDMRAALRHALDRGDRTAALRLVGGLATWWFHRGHLREGLRWVAAATGLPGTADPAVEARAALGAAQLSYGTGDATSLEPSFLAGLERAATQDEDPSVAAVAACYAGYFQATFGQLGAAQAFFVR
ncbi:MAG TPA: BTAD domain-containing putative transcriptional regulator, partial [Actinotalea sp.]